MLMLLVYIIIYTHVHVSLLIKFCRLDGLSDSPVLDVRLHEQPTGLNPLHRTSLYTKKLTWYSKLKPPHSFSSLVVARQKMSVPRKKGTCMIMFYFMIIYFNDHNSFSYRSW